MKTDQKTVTPESVALKLASLGASLRGFRLARRVTHEDAAVACSFSRQTLSRIESGDPSVAVGQIARYATFLGASKALALKSPAVDPAKRRVRRTALEQAKARALPTPSAGMATA